MESFFKEKMGAYLRPFYHPFLFPRRMMKENEQMGCDSFEHGVKESRGTYVLYANPRYGYFA
ncbi:hypothetical protein J5TS2_28410 [Brevibacillus halotolerans]|nr:hypothetical protein J5TS2_28410 [Brevibacillus halotolerans]